MKTASEAGTIEGPKCESALTVEFAGVAPGATSLPIQTHDGIARGLQYPLAAGTRTINPACAGGANLLDQSGCNERDGTGRDAVTTAFSGVCNFAIDISTCEGNVLPELVAPSTNDGELGGVSASPPPARGPPLSTRACSRLPCLPSSL